MTIPYHAACNVLVVTRGHPFDKAAFFGMLDAVSARGGWSYTHVEHPAAPGILDPERAAPFDVILYYDMPGIDFQPGRAPGRIEPPTHLREGFAALLDQGKPMLFMHHALAGWPAWREYGDAIGGRFWYTAEGDRPDDGYRHEVRHFVRVVDDHPITAGLGEGFWIEDELYLVQIAEDDKTPLLRSDHQFVRDEFYSAALGASGSLYAREGWDHPPGSNLICWTKKAGNSDIVYMQCGDGPSAYGNEGVRTLLGNAIRWLRRA